MMGQGVTVQGWKVRICPTNHQKPGVFLPLAPRRDARAWVHQLRAGCDAVIVGGGTVRADNPLLTSRGRRSPEPLRVVLSRSLDLPSQAQLWDTSLAPTLLAHGPGCADRP